MLAASAGYHRRNPINELWLSPINDMTLVAADEKLLGLGTIQTLANRLINYKHRGRVCLRGV